MLEPESNVYQFPDLLTDERRFNANASREYLIATKKEYVEDAADTIQEDVIGLLKSMGFYNGIGQYDGRDLLLLGQLLRGIMYRHYGLHHNMHDLINQAIPYTEEDQEDDAQLDLFDEPEELEEISVED